MLLLYFIIINKRQTLIKKEYYIVNKLITKALISINILKLKRIIINFNINLIIIKFYRDI